MVEVRIQCLPSQRNVEPRRALRPCPGAVLQDDDDYLTRLFQEVQGAHSAAADQTCKLDPGDRRNQVTHKDEQADPAVDIPVIWRTVREARLCRLRPTGRTPLRPNWSLPAAVAPAAADPGSLSTAPSFTRRRSTHKYSPKCPRNTSKAL